ncbi:RNA polymerase I specific transcription initiation factor RRN3 [Cryptosporidium felis]|nr:RNA polymerase I specific transcription initiation factor RRN3 [Cryptosporidium felis]
MTQSGVQSKDSSIFGLINDFDFFGSSESEFGELVHTVVDQIGVEITNNEKLFDILKRKLTILENGTLNLFGSPRTQRSEPKDIFVSQEIYFDSRFSLKKELKKICQNSEVGSQILNSRDVSILRFVFSHHRLFSNNTENGTIKDYDIFVIRHPNQDFNGCRTFSIKKRSGKSPPNDSKEDEFIPISYVSSINNIPTKWEQSGKRILHLMHSIINIVPRDIKLYMATLQDIYPLSPRNSMDSYVIYSRLLFHSIKLVPSTLSILIRFLITKLVMVESEIHTLNPNNFTEERFEKWRQEELQTMAIKIRKGSYNDIASAKSYIQDIQGLKVHFSEKFTEEDIDRNAQILDNTMKELFDFIYGVYENGFEYAKIFENSSRNPDILVQGKTSKPSFNRKNIPSSILSSSDFESSAIEDFGITGFSKKEEQQYKQFNDLETTVLGTFETQILTINKCQFVNYIPIFMVSHCELWCEKFLQITFRKLFNPHETLIVREISVNYIISFVSNFQIVSNFKFFTPCIRYLMQFLHDFVAHWNIEKSNQIQNDHQTEIYDNKRSKLKTSEFSPKAKNYTLRNLFGLYCKVVESLCILISKISIRILREKFKFYSLEDLGFLLESILNVNRGLISSVICGTLSPIERLNPRILGDFLKVTIQLVYKVIFLEKEKLDCSKYLGSIELTLELMDMNSKQEIPKDDKIEFLGKLWLRHSGKYLKKFRIDETNFNCVDESTNSQEITTQIEEILKFVEQNKQHESRNEVNGEIREDSVEINNDKEIYGEMESSILPEQSLWEYVWGNVPISEEELEQELYVTKNKVLKIDFEDVPHFEDKISQGKGNKKGANGTLRKKNSGSQEMSLLDTLVSSDAFKRGEAILHSYQRKHSPFRKNNSKIFGKSKLR